MNKICMPTWFTCMQNLNYEFKTFYVLACFLLHGTICLSSNIQLVTQAQLLTGVSIQQQCSDRPTPICAHTRTAMPGTPSSPRYNG